MDLEAYLDAMVQNRGSDLYLSVGTPPAIKINGKIHHLEAPKIEPGEVGEAACGIMTEQQIRDFAQTHEMNFALSCQGKDRYRVNVFKQRGETAMVVRSITTEIPSMESLGLPEILKPIAMNKSGLVLFVGPTGSGKSSSLAALIGHHNHNAASHIVTIEDPIEFLHSHDKSIINQREIGSDTLSYEDALQNALRQAPDVILIGEIRTREAMEHALHISETGHLCLSTLHANNADQALERIINFFPQDDRSRLYLDLALNMRAIVSQRLVTTVDHKRAAVFEVLLNTPHVADLIKQGQVADLKEVMAKSEVAGMQTFDMSLLQLYHRGKITLDEALDNADSAADLRLKVSLEESGSQADYSIDVGQENESLSLMQAKLDGSHIDHIGNKRKP